MSNPAATPSILAAEGLAMIYGADRVLDIPAINVLPKRVTAVIGPNGSGKTTLLLCLALLLKPTQGQILYNGRAVTGGDIKDLRRRFAVVFQEPLLLNTTVWENVTLGLKLRNVPHPEMRQRAEYWLNRFGIPHLVKRNARTLSGGEAQRTSLARAFVLQPEVLFLDEPFAALDVPTRQSLFGDMINILKETQFTTVLVTHDRNEAQTLANHVVMLLRGKIAQEGSPREIFSTPENEEIARFVGMENILEGTVIANQDCIADIDITGQKIEGVSNCQKGGAVNVFIRPEDITLAMTKTSSSARNVFNGRITGMVPAGPLVRVSIDCGFPLIALITRLSADEMHLEPGLTVYAAFKAAAIHVTSQN